jgi:hypothetical protein
MRARVLFAGLMAMSTVVIASPAAAKPPIAEARITGPGIEREISIGRGDSATVWEYGIGSVGGVDDARADSAEELGLTPADLGPRYVVAYRFGFHDDIRQDLYPYAEGGPVTYTPPHQKLTGLFGAAGFMRVTPGWYRSRSSLGFFLYLVDNGLPGRNPIAPFATGDAAPGKAPEAQTGSWAAMVVGVLWVLVGFVAVSLATLAVPRRVLAVGRANR